MMRSLCHVLLVVLCCLTFSVCARKGPEDPFTYPFVREIHLRPASDKPYSNYKALYLLTEDFEPYLSQTAQIDEAREVLRFASELSQRYSIPWTHFVDVGGFEAAFISDDEAVKNSCRSALDNLKQMIEKGDDCQLHLHGPISGRFREFLSGEEKLRLKVDGIENALRYRQRKSFFFNSFYRGGYREMLLSLIYGKYALERYLYDDREKVLAFRPGGWDHGASEQDTLIYFNALAASGLVANSGLSGGEFGGLTWWVGSNPGHNLAAIRLDDKEIIEVSPTRGPGGYISPVVPIDLVKLSGEPRNEVPIIVSVYHLGGLQKSKVEAENSVSEEEAMRRIEQERNALDRHFQSVSDLRAKGLVYPVTLRQLLSILSDQR